MKSEKNFILYVMYCCIFGGNGSNNCGDDMLVFGQPAKSTAMLVEK